MIKIILCPIDFSETSVQALKYAVELAADVQAKITVLYSYRLIQPGINEEILSYKRKIEEDARKRFVQLEEAVLKNFKVSYRFVMEIGFFSDSIEGHIRKNAAELLVMSRELCESLNEHKNQPFHHFIDRLTIPVVIMPQRAACEGTALEVEPVKEGLTKVSKL